MATFVILTRFSTDAFDDPKNMVSLANKVADKVQDECPGVIWKNSYATLGRYDVVDVIECDDPKQVQRAAMIIRAYGHGYTETMPATPWKEFISRLKENR